MRRRRGRLGKGLQDALGLVSSERWRGRRCSVCGSRLEPPALVVKGQKGYAHIACQALAKVGLASLTRIYAPPVSRRRPPGDDLF